MVRDRAAGFVRRWIARVALGAAVLGALALAPAGPASAVAEVGRIEGADEYQTAIRISQGLFPEGAPPDVFTGNVFIATGEDFPDGLVAGALAGGATGQSRKGSLLLTRRDRLPPGVLDEVRRLRPRQIRILGGPAAVSRAVEEELRALVPFNTRRILGVDRYETAAAIAGEFDPNDSSTVFIATGENFPDALAVAPLASRLGPILLVKRNEIPEVTARSLLRLQPSEIVVLGGTAAVSPVVESRLSTGFGPVRVRRVAGADRYETAALLSTDEDAFASPPLVLVAPGDRFAYALTAGVAAAQAGSPLLLAPPGEARPPVPLARAVSVLRPDGVIAVGDRSLVTDELVGELARLVPNPTPTTTAAATTVPVTTTTTAPAPADTTTTAPPPADTTPTDTTPPADTTPLAVTTPTDTTPTDTTPPAEGATPTAASATGQP